ncbi:helix-turn-helix domain-containing protein [Dactylosporangium sp. NPDC049742]|uniref:MerR family transcriptional regulator n=1 Tax=Dactylosporangium sp. NPDC049742 TaxID=3154737 RepID=UPI003423D958
MDGKHLLAGQFGAASRLSPKALRLYAEQGLLIPAEVDPATGYRYYRPEQLPRARLIARLRSLGLPLAKIGALLDLTPQARALELRGWLRTQRDRLDERAAVVEAVDRSGEDLALAGAVRVRDVAATRAVCRRRQVDIRGLKDLIRTAERDIRAHLRDSGLPADGLRRVCFHELVTPDSDAPVEVSIACTGPVDPVDDLYVRLIPAHTEAYLPVPAPMEDYPLILRVYDAVEAWTDARPGMVTTGRPYEVHPGTAGARFDVAYPVSP